MEPVQFVIASIRIQKSGKMNQTLIKLTYRQILNDTAVAAFERNILNDSYEEFLIQAQRYNMDGKFKTFAEMKAADPKANSLHYKVGFAVGLYLQALENKIPGLFDLSQKINIPFGICEFELVYSDIADRSKHIIALNYITNELTLHGQAGEYLVLSAGDNREKNGQWIETFMLPLYPGLTISNMQKA